VGWLLPPAFLYFLTFLRTPVPIDQSQPVVYWLIFMNMILQGGTIGFMQWLVLRRQVSHAGWWIPATMIAWLAVRPLLDSNLFGPLTNILAFSAIPAIITAVVLGFLLQQARRSPQDLVPFGAGRY
jgi:hypothetical protein